MGLEVVSGPVIEQEENISQLFKGRSTGLPFLLRLDGYYSHPKGRGIRGAGAE